MLNHDFINKLLKFDSLSYCSFCDYSTEQRPKYDRHLTTIKHKIAVSGVQCCGLTYYNKHQWINHKKSAKHRNESGGPVATSAIFNKVINKKTINLVRKPDAPLIVNVPVAEVTKKMNFKRKTKDTKKTDGADKIESNEPKKTVEIKKKEVKKSEKKVKKEVAEEKEVAKTENKPKFTFKSKKTLTISKRNDEQADSLLDIKVSSGTEVIDLPSLTQEILPTVKRTIWKTQV